MKALFVRLVFITCISIYAFSVMASGNILKDIYSGKEFSYTDNYMNVWGPFNSLEKINIRYPQLNPRKDYSQINEVNKKIYFYCVSYIDTDSFKIDFLRNARSAMKIYTNTSGNRYDQSIYSRDNQEIFLPEIEEIEYDISNLFDDLLILKVYYRYKIVKEERNQDQTFVYNKVYFISLKNARTYTLKQLFNPAKLSALKVSLEEKAFRLCQHISSSSEVEADNGVEPYEGDIIENGYEGEYSDEYEGEYVESGEEEVREVQESQPLNMDDLIIYINPLYVSFEIPAYSRYTVASGGQVLQLYYEIGEMKSYVNETSPLKSLTNFAKKFTTNLSNVNLYKDRLTYWRVKYDLLQQYAFRTAPKEGVKSFVVYLVSVAKDGDSTLQNYLQYYFLSNGQLQKAEYYSDDKVSSWNEYKYDVNHRLIKIEQYSTAGEKVYVSEFAYDTRGNLIMEKEKSMGEAADIFSYVYSGNTVYKRSFNESSMSDNSALETYTLNDYGKNTGEGFGYVNVYDKDIIMASFNKDRPKLDNGIYCYGEKGNLLTYEYDNGRHLYELKYNADGRVTKIQHFDSGSLIDKEEFFYDKNGLPVKIVKYEGVYNYYQSNGANCYKLEYEFY